MVEFAAGPVVTPEQTEMLTLSEPLPPDRNPAAVYLATLSEGSRRTMRGALNRVARLLGLEPVEIQGRKVTCHYCRWAGLRSDHVARIRSRLLEEYAPATVNKHLSAIRSTLKAAYRLSQMDVEDYQRAVAVESVTTQPQPSGRLLQRAEIDALLEACQEDATPAGARDAAMVALWAAAGPRRAEIVNLNVSDYDSERGTVRIRARRGQRKRTIHIADGAQEALDDWITVRGEVEGPLFLPIHRSGKMRISRMTPQAAYNILKKRAEETGIPSVSPHDLRRTALSNLIDRTDLSTAQRIAGHADSRTTARYDRRGREVDREGAVAMPVS
ncbi:MAG: site-specific integrase [Anaerolineae bacterium]|jgi:integrase